MMDFLKRDHTIKTLADDSGYLEDFFSAYGIKHEKKSLGIEVEYHAKMFERTFGYFCDYIKELALMGVYPIIL